MLVQDLIVLLLIGLVAGWLASFVVGGASRLGYLVSGVIGSFIGPPVVGFLERSIGFNFFVLNPAVTQILVAAIGAIVIVFIWQLLTGR